MTNETRGHVAFDTGGHLARARRLADLSQRELADVVGVGQASVARWESGGTSITVAMLARILGLAGLRLEVVAEDGEIAVPVPADVVRDNAGRRFPAHLDVAPPESRPANRGAGPRYDRAEAKGWYGLRSTRDRSIAAGLDRPSDHPTVPELAARGVALRAGRKARAARWGGSMALRQVPECTCQDACFGQPGCPDACGCQCEP
jgi:HTH-type transcriptional regulator/antitoxin HipB